MNVFETGFISVNSQFSLPEDIWGDVLNDCRSNLVAMACVSKQFELILKLYAKKNSPDASFGKKEWLKFGADPGVVLPLPLKVFQNFDHSNWMLTFIPKTINGKPLTLSSIDRFVSDSKNGKEKFKSNYLYPLTDDDIDDQTTAQFEAHWVILSKDVLGGQNLENGTRSQGILTQEKRVTEAGYEIPYLIDVVVTLLMHHLNTGHYIYGSGSHEPLWTTTCVQDQREFDRKICVGGFSKRGLAVHRSYQNCFLGMACAKRFG